MNMDKHDFATTNTKHTALGLTDDSYLTIEDPVPEPSLHVPATPADLSSLLLLTW